MLGMGDQNNTVAGYTSLHEDEDSDLDDLMVTTGSTNPEQYSNSNSSRVSYPAPPRSQHLDSMIVKNHPAPFYLRKNFQKGLACVFVLFALIAIVGFIFVRPIEPGVTVGGLKDSEILFKYPNKTSTSATTPSHATIRFRETFIISNPNFAVLDINDGNLMYRYNGTTLATVRPGAAQIALNSDHQEWAIPVEINIDKPDVVQAMLQDCEKKDLITLVTKSSFKVSFHWVTDLFEFGNEQDIKCKSTTTSMTDSDDDSSPTVIQTRHTRHDDMYTSYYQ